MYICLHEWEQNRNSTSCVCKQWFHTNNMYAVALCVYKSLRACVVHCTSMWDEWNAFRNSKLQRATFKETQTFCKAISNTMARIGTCNNERRPWNRMMRMERFLPACQAHGNLSLVFDPVRKYFQTSKIQRIERADFVKSVSDDICRARIGASLRGMAGWWQNFDYLSDLPSCISCSADPSKSTFLKLKSLFLSAFCIRWNSS